jgi:hypothetical protein
MTTDYDDQDWAHPRLREPDDDLPEILTPLDRINPLTGRGPGVRELGTVTGRITPNEPKRQDIPYIPPPFAATESARLSFEDVHFDQDTALELLNDAADLVRRALFTEPAASAVLHEAAKRWETDGAAWLARFAELGR